MNDERPRSGELDRRLTPDTALAAASAPPVARSDGERGDQGRPRQRSARRHGSRRIADRQGGQTLGLWIVIAHRVERQIAQPSPGMLKDGSPAADPSDKHEEAI